jgi:hypothetical protein
MERMSVKQYAKERGRTVQAIYTQIKRNKLPANVRAEKVCDMEVYVLVVEEERKATFTVPSSTPEIRGT